MTRLRRLALSVVFMIVSAAPNTMLAANPDPYDEVDGFASGSVYVGCTLGQNWSGFPVHLMTDFTSTSATEKLDVTLPLYVTWILYQDSTSVSQAVDPPQPITNYAWFDGYHDEFEVVVASVEDVNLYNDCPAGDYKVFEAPRAGDYPLNSSGQLHLEDVHGGIGAKSNIILQRYTNEEETEGVRLYIGWAQPKTYYDFVSSGSEDFTPGDVWRRQAIYGGLQDLYITYDVKIIEWVSTDYPAISPGLVLAADMAYFLQAYGDDGGAVRWGLESESPANSPTFQADVTNTVAAYGGLNASDLSHMSYDLGRSAACAEGKVDAQAQKRSWRGSDARKLGG